MATEKEELIKEVKGWTRALPEAELRPSITWEDMGAFHTGFSCVENAPKYLDILEDLTLMYPKPHTTYKMVYKVSMPSFWKKGSRRIVYIAYDKESVKWGLCSCTRKYLHFSFFLCFLISFKKLRPLHSHCCGNDI